MDAFRSLVLTLHRSITLLLPFTDPSTPLAQDVAHTIALCTLLYYAPHILERCRAYLQQSQADQPPQQHEIDPTAAVPAAAAPNAAPGVEPAEATPPAPQGHAHEPLPGNPTNQPPAAPLEPFDNPPPPPLGEGDPDSNPEDGPAARPARTPRQNVGAKKAKSLARRDQRRAYHEFQRSRGEAQRAADAAGAAEREAALAAERARRAAVEAELEEKTRREREERRAREEDERREELRVLRVVTEGLERMGCVDLEEVARGVARERGWVEKLVRVSGLVGGRKEEGVVTMVTGRGWVVRVDEGIMREAYRIALEGDHKKKMKVTFEELGGIIEGVILARATA
ncbi:hypothetical protein H2199_006979 [Coniosporium tulheliwenetii]|uniref:Uncharacterized protein n=1 Tax=Coniosporium tulheliwenetii TaxID=3383036 RepID=A0ACC2YSD7_9PEZI|nr:hypothetical protein H2199_006979 [Cladosporium sp. JES 115]